MLQALLRASCSSAGVALADCCGFRPRMPSGSASPTRWRDMALPRSRLASMRAAASAYDTTIWGISDAKTGSNNGPGRARANAGTRTGRTSIDTRSWSSPSGGSSTIGPGQRSRQSNRERLNRSKLTRCGQYVDFTLGRSTPRRPDESMWRSPTPARNQQTGCADGGSESTAVTSRSIRPTNASPSATWPAQLINASVPLIRSSGTSALRSPVCTDTVHGRRAEAWTACGRTP